MSFEDEIYSISEISNDPTFNFLVHSPPGHGKTYLIRTLPGKTLAANVEDGFTSISDLEDADLKDEAGVECVDIRSLKKFRQLYAYCKNSDHDYDSLALDSITEVGNIILEKMQEDHTGWQVYGELETKIRDMLEKFRQLDMNVYFSAKQQRVQDGNSMLRGPAMPGKALTEKDPIGHDFDFIFPLIMKQGENGDYKRALLTQPSEAYRAKKRDPQQVLDRLEKPDLGAIHSKLSESFN